MSTSTRLDLKALGYRPMTPKNLLGPMIGENQQLVTNEPVEVQDCRKFTDHLEEFVEYTPI